MMRSLLILIALLLTACSGSDCKNFPTTFDSYVQAKQLIETTQFALNDSVDTSKSSWIRGATYFSCDSRFGFFILRTDHGEYIFQGVPIEVWQAFKVAPSFGKFFNAAIKGRYQLQLKAGS